MAEREQRPGGEPKGEQPRRVPIRVFERPLSRLDLLRGMAAAGVGVSATGLPRGLRRRRR